MNRVAFFLFDPERHDPLLRSAYARTLSIAIAARDLGHDGVAGMFGERPAAVHAVGQALRELIAGGGGKSTPSRPAIFFRTARVLPNPSPRAAEHHPRCVGVKRLRLFPPIAAGRG